MSGKNSSDKTVSVAQNENESGDERVQGAVYGEASDVRDAERMRAYDEVRYPSEEGEIEFDLSIDGVPSDEISQKRAEQGRLDRGTDEAVDGSWGGPGGESEFDNKTLYTQERIEAREAELENISVRAGANPERYPRAAEKRSREEQTMETHQKRMQECREEVVEQAASGIVSRGYVDDAREHMTKEMVGDIYEQSLRLAERFGLSEVLVGNLLAEKVADASDVSGGVVDLLDELYIDRTVATPIEKVDPMDSIATIEGVVVELYDPPSSPNQQQAGVIEDETGEAKLTVWRNSRQDTVLSEGDVVRIQDGKPGWFNGRLTMAATSDTKMWVVEEGDGPSPMGGVEIEANSGPSGEIDDEPKPVTRYNGREQWFFKMGEDMPVPEDFEGTLPCFDGAGARDNVRTRENPETEAVVYLATSDRAHDPMGVSWSAAVRREFEQRGRQKRIDEEKYNVPEWKRETSRIDHYEHTSISEFGADERMVHLDLPPLSTEQ
jgi:hypothetical protein